MFDSSDGTAGYLPEGRRRRARALVSANGTPARRPLRALFGRMPRRTNTPRMVSWFCPWFSCVSAVSSALAPSSNVACGVSRKWCASTSLSDVRRPRAERISHRQLDQISPSSCSSPVDVLRVLLVAVETAEARRLRAAVRDGIPVADGRTHGLRLDVGEEARRQVVAEAFAHRAAFLRRAETGQLIVLQRVAVFVEDDLGVLGVVHAAGAEGQRLRRRAVERVVVGLAVDVDADRVVERVVEPQVLYVALRAVDVEVDHHFLERAIDPGEEELAIGPLDAIGRVLRRHVRAVEEPARLQIPKIHLGVRVHRNRRLVLERRVVQDGHRIGIEHAALAGDLLEQILPAEDVAARRVQVDLPLGGRLARLDDHLPRQRRTAAGLEVAQLLRQDVGFLRRAGACDGAIDGFALGQLRWAPPPSRTPLPGACLTAFIVGIGTTSLVTLNTWPSLSMSTRIQAPDTGLPA